jgi:mRNA interferase RelE/StbE
MMNSKPATPRFSLTYSDDFEDLLRELDKGASRPIAKKLDVISLTGELPKVEPLSGKLKGLHRIRVGNYRVLIEIDFENQIVLAVGLDHRGVVYRKRR